MATNGDLRRVLADLVTQHLRSENTHATLNDAFTELTMPQTAKDAGSLAERIKASYTQTPDASLPEVAMRLLEQGSLKPSDRNRLQDLLWEGTAPTITIRVRRELSQALILSDMAIHRGRFMAMLDRFWILHDGDSIAYLLTGVHQPSLLDRIEQHVFRNPGDWSTQDLFEHLDAFNASDARFARFLEATVSADVLLDETPQRDLAAQINDHLRAAGLELRETGKSDGYPRFTLLPTGTPHSQRPKNIIFASSKKPDIRFRSAVDNEIEIVGNTADVLVYDRDTPDTGLRWQDLLNWWQDTHHITDSTAAKRTLYQRLISSLPTNSPGQRNFFELYHKILGQAVHTSPALLPEVWLHWDPKTVRERGPEALVRSRMDFLLLFPHGLRIVIEVDGSQHYTRDGGRAPDSGKYAQTMAADRDLRLRGYEVFRFGHDELRDKQQAEALLREFLPALLQRFT